MTLNYSGVETKKVSEFVEKAYLDYAMSVILDRALPHISDGLKPVQRRIIYAMSELGLRATNKYKKSARTIGDVLGKYHPHGDSACYEAMVLMAQTFSYRYTLIDGQGNWGSLDDPKSFAAMRYTESRLSPYANLLLDEIGQATVEWIPNFDGTLQEPTNLPAQLPNLLLNGTSGIAVGMATDIPPHNLTEIINASVLLLEKPNASVNEVMQVLPAPDYPTGGEIITEAAQIATIYSTGLGSIKIRAKFSQENDLIIIEQLPYRVAVSELLVQISKQMQNKKLPMLVSIRDESDYENPVRLVLIVKSKRIDIEMLMSHLFATTDLEKSYRVNMNCIGLNGKPQVKPLIPLLKEWIEFRITTTTKKLNYRLKQINERLHLLEGFLITFLNIDEIIAIIRYEDNPMATIMKRFRLSETQAKAILNLQLKHISKLEEVKITAEQTELNTEKNALQLLLNSKNRLITYVKKNLLKLKSLYGDERRSTIIERKESKALATEHSIANEKIWVHLSVNGWIRATKSEIKTENLTLKSGDSHLQSIQTNAKLHIAFLDTTGRSYSTQVYKLPATKGEPLTSRFTIENNAKIIGMLSNNEQQPYLIASTGGYGFITDLKNLLCNYKLGKNLLTVNKGFEALPPTLISPEQKWVVVITSEAKMLIFSLEQLPKLSKGKGNKLIKLKPNQTILATAVFAETDTIVVYTSTSQKSFTWKQLKNSIANRATSGKTAPAAFKNTKFIEVIRTTH